MFTAIARGLLVKHASPYIEVEGAYDALCVAPASVFADPLPFCLSVRSLARSLDAVAC